MEQKDLEKALGEVTIIKKAVERAEGLETTVGLKGAALEANLLVQGGALCLGFGTLLTELFWSPPLSNTTMLMLSKTNENIRIGGLITGGMYLAILILCLYLVIIIAARKEKISPSDYINQSFVYLRNLSFIADLFVKFVIFSLIIVAQKPEWIPPLLILFTGDYLIQGRLFSLPVSTSLIGGIFCLITSLAVFYYGQITLVGPLSIFTLVAATSFVRVLMAWRKNRIRSNEVDYASN